MGVQRGPTPSTGASGKTVVFPGNRRKPGSRDGSASPLYPCLMYRGGMADKQLTRWARQGVSSVLMFGKEWDIRGADEVSVDYRKKRVNVGTPWKGTGMHQKIKRAHQRAKGTSIKTTWG